MKMQALPASLIPRTKSSVFRVSVTDSPIVGSSRMTNSASKWSARAIATPWRSPPDIEPTNESGVTACEVKRRNSSISLSVSARIAGTSSSPMRLVRSRPMKMFRQSDCWSARARSW